MSQMAPEPAPQQSGGNVLTQRYMGIPGIVWLAGAALVAYFLFFRGKSSSSSSAPSSSGGGGTSSTGDIALTPGSTTIQLPTTGDTSAPVQNSSGGSTDTNNPGQPSQSGTPNPQPTPTPTPRDVETHTSVSYTNYTVQKGETLAEIAKKFGISIATLAHANVYVPGEVPGNKKVGQTLGTGAGLKTGQVLRIPHVKTTTSG